MIKLHNPSTGEEVLVNYNSSEPCQIHIVNKSSQAIAVCWLDENKAETEYAKVQPGSSVLQPTFVGHPWILRDSIKRRPFYMHVAGQGTCNLIIQKHPKQHNSLEVVVEQESPPNAPNAADSTPPVSETTVGCEGDEVQEAKAQEEEVVVEKQDEKQDEEKKDNGGSDQNTGVLPTPDDVVQTEGGAGGASNVELKDSVHSLSINDESGEEEQCEEGYSARAAATTSAGEISICAFGCVSKKAIKIAKHVVQKMLERASKDICDRLVAGNASIAVIGRSQVTSDMPPHTFLKNLQTGETSGRSYDTGCRGVGGTCSVPCTSVGEENLLMEDGDRYGEESILVHEFGHCVMNVGFSPDELDRVKRLYERAKDAGGHGNTSSYLMSNVEEYWAELTQAWFDANSREDVNCGIRTRADVKKRDPKVAELLIEVYGDGDWRYYKDCPRPDKWKKFQKQ